METTLFAPADLLAAAEAYRQTHPHARARNVAAALGVAEAQLLAARCGPSGDGAPAVLRLRAEFPALLMGLEACGPLMALTRNDAVVHEKDGVYRAGQMMPKHRMGLFNDEQIDLRLFFDHWAMGFFAEEGGRLSFQFFDADGSAIHKVYARAQTDVAAFRALAGAFAAEDQSPEQPVTPVQWPDDAPADALDLPAFYAAWRALQDTHDFYGLLRTHGVSRRQAVRHAPEDLARPLAPGAPRRVLDAAAASGQPIMVFVGNEGAVQIHTGPVQKLVQAGPWYNVLDEGFNLHLHEALIAESYIVVKPTADGVVTSVECFDAAGHLVVQFFGKRKPGLPEREDWRALVAAALKLASQDQNPFVLRLDKGADGSALIREQPGAGLGCSCRGATRRACGGAPRSRLWA